nr:MAG TPA: hypothetical protein [Caudoviricetes sp.]
MLKIKSGKKTGKLKRQSEWKDNGKKLFTRRE